MSTQIREDQSKITLIPTREKSLRMILLQHVINRKTPKSCIITQPWRNYGRGKWTQAISWVPGLSSYSITGWFNPEGAVSTCLVSVHPEGTHWLASVTHLQMVLKQARERTWTVLTQNPQNTHKSPPSPPLRLETCRTLGSVTKVLNWSSKEPEGQTGQD